MLRVTVTAVFLPAAEALTPDERNDVATRFEKYAQRIGQVGTDYEEPICNTPEEQAEYNRLTQFLKVNAEVKDVATDAEAMKLFSDAVNDVEGVSICAVSARKPH